MNSGLRPIPATMPLDRAADLMVRRGESRNWHQARGRLILQRARVIYGRTRVNPNDPALTAVESPTREIRLPYRDD